MLRCLVFGGSGVIGSSTTDLLARMGHHVGATYFNTPQETDSSSGSESEVFWTRCDVRDPTQVVATVESFVQTHGAPDAVIYAVGDPAETTSFIDPAAQAQYVLVTAAELRRALDLNTLGAIHVCQAVSNIMTATGGNIVIVGALDGFKAMPSPVHFAASKAALKGVVESLAKRLGAFNIRVNLVVPGLLDLGASSAIDASLKQTYLKHCGLKRFAKREEVADMLAWFATENTYITGQAIVMDGGL